MQRTPIPGTALAPSALCLGSATFGNGIARDEAFRLLDAYVGLGGTFLDTASVYADWLPGEKSSSEKTIGRWLGRRGKRDDLVLATKGAHPELGSMHIPRLAPGQIVADLEASLDNLGTDYIDLYWLHRDDPARPVAEILDTLVEQVARGTIRYFGCSNWRMARIDEARAHAEATGTPGFVANQPMWSLAHVDPTSLSDPTMVVMDAALHRFHRENGLAAIPYASQANGWFQKRAAQIAETELPARYAAAQNEGRLERVQQLAEARSLTITQVVLGYLLSQPFATIPIVGCRTPAQLVDSMAAGDVRLSPDEVSFLEGTPDATT